MTNQSVYLWLDDLRPAPPGFLHVKTVPEAQAVLLSGNVQRASLDHDLGLCSECTAKEDQLNIQQNCQHNPTGYDLVKWMAETGNWPKFKPIVHSANPVGRANMQSTINRYFPYEE